MKTLNGIEFNAEPQETVDLTSICGSTCRRLVILFFGFVVERFLCCCQCPTILF